MLNTASIIFHIVNTVPGVEENRSYKKCPDTSHLMERLFLPQTAIIP